MTHTTFGNFVKERRLAHRLSIKELAERVGRSESAIRDWERGKSRPHQDELLDALAKALRVGVDELRVAAGEEPRRPPPPPPEPYQTYQPTRTYRDDPHEMIVYWVRGLLTTAALILLAVVLVWAMGGLMEQMGGLFDQ